MMLPAEDEKRKTITLSLENKKRREKKNLQRNTETEYVLVCHDNFLDII